MTCLLEFTKAKVDPDGWLCLQVKNVPHARQFVLGMKEGGEYAADLRVSSKRRSLDANGYFWRLAQDLADAIGVTKNEVYLRAVKEVGAYRDFHLSVDEAKSFRVAWEALGAGWPTEQVDFYGGDMVTIRAYYGSSTYSTKRMGRLIDNVVQDCKAVGVETLPPEKLQALMEEYRPIKMGGQNVQ